MLKTSHKPQATSHKPFKLGFTLSELLVSLAVLGLIAGLTVPSIVASVDKSKNKAILKEDFQILSSIIQAGVLSGDFDSLTSWDIVNQNGPTSLTGYFNSKLNSTRQCLTGDFTSQGCSKNDPTSIWGQDFTNNHNGRWVLPNGSKLKFNATNQVNTNADVTFNILSKADQTSFIYTGSNPNVIFLRCNLSQNTIVTSGLTLKAGTCDGYNSSTYKDQLTTILFGA